MPDETTELLDFWLSVAAHCVGILAFAVSIGLIGIGLVISLILWPLSSWMF